MEKNEVIPSGGKYTDTASTLNSQENNIIFDENKEDPINLEEDNNNNMSSPQDYLKERLLKKNKAYQRAKNIQDNWNKAVNTGSFLINLISAIGSFLISPIGIASIVIVVSAWVVSSTALIMGPQKFGSICQANGAPQIELVDDDKQSATVANYFSYGDSISKGAAAYLANMAATKTATDFTRSTGVPENCDTQCIYNKMLSGEIDMNKLKLGAFNLQREDAAQLIYTAVQEGEEWTNSSTQLAYVQKMISGIAAGEKSKIGSDKSEDLKDSIKEINQTFGISMSEADLEKSTQEAESTKDSIKGSAETCKPMGDGSCVGRMDGGDALCTRGGSGGSGSGEIGGGDIGVLEAVLNTPVDMDGHFGAQCWDMTNFYLQKLGSKGIAGGSGRAGYIGHDFKAQLEAEGFEVILNPSPSDLRPGDVFNTTPGVGVSDPYYGHTGVIGEVKEGGVFITYEQNAEKGQIVAKYERTFPANGIMSIIRKR